MDIKTIRKQLDLTQQELAVKLGVAVATVYRWEKGTSKPSKMARKQLENLI